MAKKKTTQKALKDIILDDNWTSPAALADELRVSPSNVSSWISRNQIDYVKLPGVKTRGHLVDRRTAPVVRFAGRSAKKSK